MKKKTPAKTKVKKSIPVPTPELLGHDEKEGVEYETPPALSRAMIAFVTLVRQNIGVNVSGLYALEKEIEGMMEDVSWEQTPAATRKKAKPRPKAKKSAKKKKKSPKAELQKSGVYVRDDWASMDAISLKEIYKKGNTWKPVRIIGRIASYTQPEPVELESGENVTILTFTIKDRKGDSIVTLPIPFGSLRTEIQTLHAQHTNCAFHGAVVWVRNIRGKGMFRFFLSEIRTDISPMDQIEERPSGKIRKGFSVKIGSDRLGIPEDHPVWTVDDHKGFKARMSYIKSLLATNLNIRALTSAKELDQCIEFMILQALSQGREHFSLKLHSLVIGPPNVGKGFLAAVALILNPVGQEVSSTSAKCTAAGLVGSVKRGSSGNTSEPGALPQNSGGVVCIQEFHDLGKGKRKELFSMFARFMEEGKVIDSTSANTVHEAETSLHIDQNRYSQIYGDRKAEFNTYSDIDIPMNILSRFDFIMEIPADATRQDEVAGAMKFGALGGRHDDWRAKEWERRLRMLIAYLRTETPRVEFSAEIQKYIDEKVTALLKTVKEGEQYRKVIQDIQLRFVRSVYKIVKVVACLDMEYEARKEHVDYALKFVKHKLEFITHIKVEEITTDVADGKDSSARQRLLQEEYKGKMFTAKDAVKFLSEKHSVEVSAKTVKRDFEALGAKQTKPGKWSLT